MFRINSSVIKRNTGLSCKLHDWQNNRVKANSKKEKYYGYDEINEKLQEVNSIGVLIHFLFHYCKRKYVHMVGAVPNQFSRGYNLWKILLWLHLSNEYGYGGNGDSFKKTKLAN